MICGSCRTLAVAAGIVLTAGLLEAQPGQAQSWPQRPVKLILTLGPGSGTDIGMRLLADRLPKVWNHPVVVGDVLQGERSAHASSAGPFLAMSRPRRAS